MNTSTTAGPTGFGWLRSLLAFRHRTPLARWVSAAASAALVTAAAVVWVAAPAHAASPCPVPGGFEIDGDMTHSTCDPAGDDWNTSSIDVTSTTQGGTYSTSGKDDGDPSGWSSTGSTPDKTDFERAYATSRIVGGHYYVFVAWERTNTTGTQGYAIEIDNSGANIGSDGHTPQPDRSSGGSVFYISSQGAAAPKFASACSFTSQSNYGDTCTTSDASISSAINTTSISDPIAGTAQAAGSFFEVALDITALTGKGPSCPGASAASVYLRSVTGQVDNGNLKGYLAPLEVAPDSTCVAPSVTTQTQQNDQIDGLDVVAPNTPQHDVATVTGTDAHPAPTGSVKFFLCGPTGSAADCTTGGQSAGTHALVQHASNSTAQSDDLAPSTPGWYCWRAEFTPDPVNNDNPFLPVKATVKTNECFKVAHATPSISTVSSATTDVGAVTKSVGFTTLGDVATLSNVYSGANLSGQHVTFSLYGPLGSAPGANDCTVGVRVFGPEDAPLTQANATTWTATAPTYKPTAGDGPGYYTWIASYAGDEINDGDTGACGAANETQHLVGPLLTLTKGTPHSTITAGDDIVYDVNLANVGEGTASGVVVTDVLPILAGGGSWTLDGTNGYGCSIADVTTGPNAGHQVVTCDVGDLDPSVSTTIAEVSATTTALDCGDIDNSAVLAADPDVSQTAGPITVHVKCPGLAIDKTADAESVDVGSPIGFTVTVTNDGAGTATAVDLSDPLPTGPGITWTIDTDPLKTLGPLSCSISSGTLHCTGSLAADATQVVHITSPTEWTGSGQDEVNSCLGGQHEDGVYDNTAQVSASNVLDSPTASADTAVLCPDLGITKIADDTSVNAGESIGFLITATNSGAGSATGALVYDALPAGVTWTIDDASGPLACGIVAGVLSCTGTLGTGQSETVHLTAETTFADCAAYDNTANLTATNTPQAPTSSARTQVLCPDLTLTKTADAASVDAGSQIGFTVTASNSGAQGTGSATGVVIDDPLPAGSGVSWSIASGPDNCSIEGSAPSQTLHCTAVDLGPGDSEVVHVVSATNFASCAAYPNTASLTSTNSPSLTASATTTVLCADLTLTKTADAASVDAGSPIGFTVTASNSGAQGTGSATGVVIDDPLPAGSGVSWSIASGPDNCSIEGSAPSQTLHCTAVDLGPGDSEVVHVVSATSFASCTAYPNTASLTARNSPSLTADATTTVLCPGLNLTKTADAASVNAGSQIGFTVTAANSDTENTGIATGVVIDDPLPAGSGVSWSIASGPDNCSIDGSAPSQTLHCTAVDLGPGDSEVVHVVSATSFASCAVYPNTASLTSTNSPSLTASATTTVLCADLTLTKTADAASVNAGSQIGFTVTASNSDAEGTGTAIGVVIDDLLPAGSGVNWSIASGPANCSIEGGPASQTLHCTAVDLGPGDSEVVHVVSGTSFVSCQSYENTASLDATNHPSLTASATTTVLCADLVLAKTADAASVNAGGQIGFTITASNVDGEDVGTAFGVVIDDPLPAGTGIDWSIASGPENCTIQGVPPTETLHCTAVDLEPGASESVHVVSGTGNTSCATYPNVASLTADNAPALTANASTTVANCVVVSPPVVSPPHVKPPAALPNTGGPNRWLPVAGFVLLLAGGMLVASDRRRRLRS